MAVTASGSLWSTFTARAELLGAAVMRTASEDAVATLLLEAAPGFSCTRKTAQHFPRVADRSGTGASDVVTVGEFAVAETGSVCVDEPSFDRGRCFLAERLWVLVGEQSLVAGLDEAVQRVGALVRGGAHHPLLMSGPSRTADIERVLTIGVHGPRALVILVVGASELPDAPRAVRP